MKLMDRPTAAICAYRVLLTGQPYPEGGMP